MRVTTGDASLKPSVTTLVKASSRKDLKRVPLRQKSSQPAVRGGSSVARRLRLLRGDSEDVEGDEWDSTSMSELFRASESMEGSCSSSEEERHSSWFVGGTVGGESLSLLTIFMLSDKMGQSN